MEIKDLVIALDAQMTSGYEEFSKMMEELGQYRGRALEESEVPTVNDLLKRIQFKFAEIYPAYHFIGHRYQHVTNVVNGYNEFLEMLQKNGAKRNEEQGAQ